MDYESLLEEGVLMGQASFSAYDDSACVIDLALFSIGFNEGETCGKNCCSSRSQQHCSGHQ